MNETEAKALTGGWWLLLLVGALSVIAGVIILFKPSDSLATLAVIAGIFLLLDGILELADAFFGSTAARGTSHPGPATPLTRRWPARSAPSRVLVYWAWAPHCRCSST